MKKLVRNLCNKGVPQARRHYSSLPMARNSLNEFGKRVFMPIVHEEKNVVLSPLSIFTALGMVSFGANGVTKSEILNTLQFGNHDAVEPSITHLLSAFQSARDAGIISLANNTFLRNGIKLNEKFVADLSRIYHSEVIVKDFFFDSAEKSAQEINKWVEDKTHNKIKNLLAPNVFTPYTMLVLISAVYFKANWDQAFAVADTRDSEFNVTPARTVPIKMMHIRGKKMQYGENATAKWVRLAYKPKGEFSAVFVLPQKSGNLAGVVPMLFSDAAKLPLETQEKEVSVLGIPKFKIEFGAELKELLEQIGIKAAFNDNADLTKIVDGEELKISNVIHKAMIEVDETGTVAAAATAVVVSRKGSMRVGNVITFIADEPFFFLLEHIPSKSIIFTAKIHDPSSSS